MKHAQMISRVLGAATAAVCFASFATGCARPMTPTATAAKVEHLQCPGVEHDDLALLQGTTVIKAEPIYSRQPSKTGEDERVSGVKLVIRPPEGVSAERLTRTIQCHSAKALLGQVDRSQLPADPYVLPDEWLDISVSTEDGNYAVSLQADTVSKNLQVFNRVRTYADQHGARSVAQ